MKLLKLLVLSVVFLSFFSTQVRGQILPTFSDTLIQPKPIHRMSLQYMKDLETATSPRKEVRLVGTQSESRLLFESFLPVEDFKRLRNGIDVPGFGTVYVKSGARWRVEEGNPFLTRTLTVRNGGPMLSQEYRFTDFRDLRQAVVTRPFQRLISRISGER